MWDMAFHNLMILNTGTENRLYVVSGVKNPQSLVESCECGRMIEIYVYIPDDKSREWVLSW